MPQFLDNCVNICFHINNGYKGYKKGTPTHPGAIGSQAWSYDIYGQTLGKRHM